MSWQGSHGPFHPGAGNSGETGLDPVRWTTKGLTGASKPVCMAAARPKGFVGPLTRWKRGHNFWDIQTFFVALINIDDAIVGLKKFLDYDDREF